jgi:restriction system protein
VAMGHRVNARTTDPYHFTPEVLNLSIEALIRVNRGKGDVLVWLRSAGVPETLVSSWRGKLDTNREQVSKAAIARDVLIRLNEAGDRYLQQRREVIKRLVETEDYSSCWPDDVLAAQGLIAQLRISVNVRDSFTRIKIETEGASRRQRESRDRDLQEKRARASALRELNTTLIHLVTDGSNPQERGRQFEKQLTRLFNMSGIQITEPFRTENEQIDGAIHFDGHTYLVEARWWAHPLGHGDVADLFVKMATRPSDTRGIYVSASGFTDGCVEECVKTKMAAIFATLEDIILCLESERPLDEMLVKKFQRYITERRMMVPFREL